MPKDEFDRILNEKYQTEVQIPDNAGIFEIAGRSIVGMYILARRFQTDILAPQAEGIPDYE